MRLFRRSLFVAISIGLAVVVAVAVVIAVALDGGFDKTTAKRTSGRGTKIVRIALVDATIGFDVTPDVVTVDPGTHLILDVVNQGHAAHNLAVNGGSSRTRMLNPGESQRLDVGIATQDIRMWCTLPEHKLAGMALEIRISDTPAAGRGSTQRQATRDRHAKTAQWSAHRLTITPRQSA